MRVEPKGYDGKFLICTRATEFHREGLEFPVNEIVSVYEELDPDFSKIRGAIHSIRSTATSLKLYPNRCDQRSLSFPDDDESDKIFPLAEIAEAQRRLDPDGQRLANAISSLRSRGSNSEQDVKIII